MKIPRRRFLHLAAGAVALPALSHAAWAQAYPSRPVRIVVGFPAGGPADILARVMGQWLSDRLGQPFIIENRPGAGSNIATEVVVRAPPDGYTLLLVAPANTINATLYDKLNFNFIHDIAPVASIARSFYVMEVHPSVPVKTVSEFIAYAKANPGKINMASAGSGTPQHVAGELFKIMTGVDMVHVPYRGAAPALTDLIGGQVQVMFDNMSSSIEHIKAGKLRPLAVTTATRYGGDAGHPNRGRLRSRLRGEWPVRFRNSEEHTYCCHRQAERRNQRRPLRSTDQVAARRLGQRGSGRHASCLRQAYRG